MSKYMEHPRVYSSLMELKAALDEAITEAGGERKLLAVLVHSTLGGASMQDGCGCPACKVGLTLNFARMVGAEMEVVEDRVKADGSAASQVH